MNPRTIERLVPGPAGQIETAWSLPGEPPRGIALVAHPHPLYGGAMDNKVVQTLAKVFVGLGYAAIRFNFRGVGRSEGSHDEGRGETDDAVAVLEFCRRELGDIPVTLAGFSFGSFVQTRVAERTGAKKLVLVGAAVNRFQVGTVPAGTLVIHGEQDDVVPLADVLDWARPQKLPVVVLPGAGHFFHGYLVELKRIVGDACR